MAFLPPEIVENILSHCDRDTLVSAAQATTVAEQYFYKFLHVNSTERGRQLVTALSNPKHGERRRKIVRGVRLFQIMDTNLCTALLQLLPELERLNIINWCGGLTLPGAGGFCFKLRRLRIANECDHLTPMEFVTFLEQQETLEVLEFVWSESPRRSTSVCARARYTGLPLLLPQLKALRASEDMVLAFLSQKRPLLQEIRFYAAIKDFAKNLQYLMVGTNDVAQTIRLLAEVCPHLHTLKLIFDHTRAFRQFRDVFEIRDFGQKIALPDFPSLRHLALHAVGLARESEARPLALAFELVMNPGIWSVMPGLEVCGLTLYFGHIENATVILPSRDMARPSAAVPDWHLFHENFGDKEFFFED